MLEEQIEEHIRHTRDGFLIVWLAVRACGIVRESFYESRVRGDRLGGGSSRLSPRETVDILRLSQLDVSSGVSIGDAIARVDLTSVGHESSNSASPSDPVRTSAAISSSARTGRES